MKKNKIIFLIILIISIGIVAILFIRAYQNKKDYQPPPSIERIQKEEGIPVHTIAPMIQDMEDLLLVDGSVRPEKKAIITSRIDRIIKKITVDEGDPVMKDNVVVLLEKESIESNLLATRSALDEAEQDFSRAQALFESGAIARQDLDQARVALLRATALNELSRERVRDTRITSPLTGLVSRRYKEPGELSDKGKAILEIVDIRNVEVYCQISETKIKDLHIDQPVRITLDAYPDRVWEERISTINPTAREISRLFTVKIIVANPGLLLRPGMYARVEIINESHHNVLVLPQEAIVKDARGEPGVFLVSDTDTVTFTPITPGIRKLGLVEIQSELDRDSRVVVSGQNRLEDGSKVKVGSGE
ncbi:MAG TPA: efflux RND transporter periplasmic adaptor subunit [Proteobacteria bacterium]|nr:efflux RND transporter periplasmic adaptor subunit [Pseudomonadota bacterium]